MTEKTALAHLKAQVQKLKDAQSSAVSAETEVLALSSVIHPSGMVALAAKYAVGAIKNVDWNPDDHPRNPHTGEFMKTLGGYIFGKAKKAKFAGTDVEMDLVPGAVAFKTNAGNIIISEPDGSYKMLTKMSGYKDIKVVPEGSHSTIADNAASGTYTKIAENPGVKVAADSEQEAAQKLEHPEEFKTADSKIEVASTLAPVESGITSIPELKKNKTVPTAKQYAEYQMANSGKVLFTDIAGTPVVSGGWIDVDGKPYLVHASAAKQGGVSVYRWVSTKQQASNLVKEDFFSAEQLVASKSIEDPTGTPYGATKTVDDVDVMDIEGTAKKMKPTTGSLMSQAISGPVPNTSVAHKAYMAEAAGKPLLALPAGGLTNPVTFYAPDTEGTQGLVVSGEWVEIEGKPYKISSSPNPGLVSLTKWVSSKQQASNNSYDFPMGVVNAAVQISDPTGAEYVPLATKVKDGDLKAPEETKPLEFSADKFVEMHNSGEITPSDLSILANSGLSTAAAAGEAIEKLAEQEKVKFQKDLSEFETYHLVSTNGTDIEKALKFAPKGTVFTKPLSENAPSSAWGTYILAEDGWQHADENKGHALLTDAELEGLLTPASAQDMLVLAEGSGAYDTALNNPALKKTSEKVTMSFGDFYSKGGKWYDANNVAPSEASVAAITAALLARSKAKEDLFANGGGHFLVTHATKGLARRFLVSSGNSNQILTSEEDLDWPGNTTHDLWDKQQVEDYFSAPESTLGSWTVEETHPNVDAAKAEMAQEAEGKDLFVHPDSGETHVLQPGAIVWKHLSTSGYIIETPGDENPIQFFNKFGKKYKPKKEHKGLSSQYAPVTDWPGKKSDSENENLDNPLLSGPAVGDVQEAVKTATAGDVLGVLSPTTDEWLYYTKNSDGWTSQKYGSEITDASVAVAVKGFTPDQLTFTHAEPETAPWGGASAEPGPDSDPMPLTPVAEAKKKAKTGTPAEKKAAKKTLAGPEKGGYFTFPSGKEIEVKPGYWLAAFPQADGTVKYVTPSGYKQKNYPKYTFYDEEGTLKNSGNEHAFHALGDLTPKTPLQTKKAALKAGYLVLDNPVSVMDLTEVLDKYEAAPGYNQNAATTLPKWENNTFQPSLGGFNVSWAGEVYEGAPNVNLDNKSWNSATPTERLSCLTEALPNLAAGLKAVDVTLADTHTDYVTNRLKRTKKYLEHVVRGLALAERIVDPTSGLTMEELDQEYYAVAALLGVDKSKQALLGDNEALKTRFPHQSLMLALQQARAERQFAEKTKDLGFDPFNGTTAEYDSYAKGKGFSLLPALPSEAQKTWVLNSLGYTGLPYGTLSVLKKEVAKASVKQAVATSSANLKKNLPEKFDSHGGVAISMSLSDKYEIDGTEWKNVGADEWQSAQGDVITDAAISVVINNALESGTPVVSSETPAYGTKSGGDNFKALKEKHGFTIPSSIYVDDSNESLTKTIAMLGGPSESAVTQVQLMWLVAHANGDSIAKYSLEKSLWYKGTHPDEATHPGSPTANPGAYKALAETVSDEYLTHPYTHTAHMADTFWGTPDAYGLAPSMNFGDSWHISHPVEEIKKFKGLAPGALPSETAKAEKPSDVSDDVWSLVAGSESMEDILPVLASGVHPESYKNWTLGDVRTSIVGTTAANNIGLSALNVSALPDHLAFLLNWALSNHDNVSTSEYFSAVAARLNAGEFYTDQTPVWIGPDGTKYPISPGSVVKKQKNGDNFGVIAPNGTSAYHISPDGDTKKLTAYSLSYVTGEDYETVFTMPDPITWLALKFAQSENSSLIWTKSHFDESEKIEQGKSSQFDHPAVGGALTKVLKDSPVLSKDYPTLYAHRANLPENVRKGVAAALEQGDTALLQVMEFKAFKGHYNAIQTMGMFDSGNSWVAFISKGLTSAEDISHHWSPAAIKDYAQHFGISETEVPAHLNSRLNPEAPKAASKAIPALDALKLTWVKSKSVGMHSGDLWADQDGNEWMTKSFPNDPNGKARVDAEVQANLIGTLFGFASPTVHQTDTTKHSTDNKASNHKYTYLQHLKPATGDLSAAQPSNMSTKQLSQAMQEHVLDWITSNHDSHAANLLFDPQNNVFGIDKGQAFKHFPNDKLAVGYLPPENGAKVWYDRFYLAVQNGTIDKKTLDEVTKSVLRKAKHVAQTNDEAYRKHLELALQNRTFWPSEYPSRESFIDALVDRKHGTFEDFAKFYKDLYKKSPHEFDIDLDNLNPPKVGQAHIAVTQDLADEVKKTSVHGKSIFFDTPDLNNQNLILSVAQSKDGQTTLTGQAMVTETGDQKLTDWLKKQTVVKVSGTPHVYDQNNITLPNTDAKDPSYLPNAAFWFPSMVAASKTVSSHNASGDQKYNVDTLEKAGVLNKQMLSSKAVLEQALSENPDSLATVTVHENAGGTYTFLTKEQQDAYLSMLDTYIGYHAQVEEKKGTAEKISPHFTPFSYEASAAAKASLSTDYTHLTKDKPGNYEDAPMGAKIFFVADPSNGSYTWTKTGAKEWTNSKGTKHTGPIYDWASENWGYTAPSEKSEPVEEEAISNTLTLGTKQVKVTLRPSAVANAQYDMEKGTLTLTGGEFTSSGGGAIDQSGSMYEIDFGGTRVFYRPWKNHGVNLAQQGLLRFDHDDWDGDPSTIEEIFSVLRHAGLDLDPATEASLELQYWTHLTAILKDRKDTKTGKWAKVTKTIMDGLKEGMSSEDRLALHQSAWAEAMGQEKVDNARWQPQFSHQNFRAKGDTEDEILTTGHPFWFRPDVSLQDIKDGGFRAASTNLNYGGSAADAIKIALSGSMLSAEERARYYGELAKGGASSGSDGTKGSSGTVFIKPNSNWGSENHVVYHPRVYLRSDNYQFDHDGYGAVSLKSTHSHWEAPNAFNGTELMASNAVSVMDDIIMLQFPNEADRSKAIKAYKSHGVDHLHGIPIEDVFVTSVAAHSVQQRFQQILDAAIQNEIEV